MKTFALPRNSLLTKSYQYTNVYNNGQRLRGKDFSLIFIPNHRHEDRLGISISGVRLAVTRNRLKRIIKEFYRLNRSFPSLVAGNDKETQKVDMVIASRKKFLPGNLHELGNLLLPLTHGTARNAPSCK